jgi:hypothetical protein
MADNWAAPGGVTAAWREGRMKPKMNYKSDPTVSNPMDRCETPAYALDPLLPYLRSGWLIWEPACGSGRIVRTLTAQGFTVTGSDLLDGRSFFDWQPRDFDAIVTNPPYSIKPEWIRRCYALGKPFALLVPVETIGGGAVQAMMDHFGSELLLLNKRVNFYMPNNKELSGNGAQFPVLWFCWQMLPAPIVYGKITRRADEQESLFAEVPA